MQCTIICSNEENDLLVTGIKTAWESYKKKSLEQNIDSDLHSREHVNHDYTLKNSTTCDNSMQ